MLSIGLQRMLNAALHLKVMELSGVIASERLSYLHHATRSLRNIELTSHRKDLSRVGYHFRA